MAVLLLSSLNSVKNYRILVNMHLKREWASFQIASYVRQSWRGSNPRRPSLRSRVCPLSPAILELTMCNLTSGLPLEKASFRWPLWTLNAILGNVSCSYHLHRLRKMRVEHSDNFSCLCASLLVPVYWVTHLVQAQKKKYSAAFYDVQCAISIKVQNKSSWY